VAKKINVEVDSDTPWNDQIVQIILQMDETFARYPGVATRIISRSRPSPARDALTNAVLVVLRSAGFTPNEVRDLESALHFLFSGWLLGKPPALRTEPATADLLERCTRRLLEGFAVSSKNAARLEIVRGGKGPRRG
jgi:hypothetical protein